MRCAYINALKMISNGYTWKKVCELTVKQLIQVGIHKISHPETIRRWHRYFRTHLSFPHPNRYIQSGVTPTCKLFETYPKAKVMFKSWCSQNIHLLSSESACGYVLGVIIPHFFQHHLTECSQSETTPYSQDDFLTLLGLKTVDVSTVWRWLKQIGFEYKHNIKCYYTDKHESEENIAARNAYINTYLELEICTYSWVNIRENVAKSLEEEYEIFQAYFTNIKKMVKYTVSIILILMMNLRNMSITKKWVLNYQLGNPATRTPLSSLARMKLFTNSSPLHQCPV